MRLYAIREEEGVKWISIDKPDLHVSQKVKYWDKDLKVVNSKVVTHEFDSMKDLDEVIRITNSAGTLGLKLTGETLKKKSLDK